MKFRSLVLAGCALTVLATATAASAQTVNYDDLELIFGEPITLGATGTPKRASDAPANITIVTADDIQRSGARTIPDVLERYVGVSVFNSSPLDRNVSIRGYNRGNARSLMVLIDGRRVFNQEFGFVLWSALPVALSEIRQIEIIRGGVTALYGQNAINGVINIVTYGPGDEAKNTVVGRGGTAGYVGGEGAFRTGLGDRVDVAVSAIGHRQDEATANPLFSRFQRFSDDEHAYGVRGQVAIGITDNLKTRFEVTYGDSDVYQATVASTNLFNEERDLSILGELQGQVGDTQFTLRAYTNRHESTFSGISTDGEPGEGGNRYINVSLSGFRPITSKLNARGQLEFSRNASDVEGPPADDKFVLSSFAASLLLDYEINARLSVAVAGRFDHFRTRRTDPPPAFVPIPFEDFERSFTEPSFNVSLLYRATQKDTFKLLGGRSFALPTTGELGSTQTPIRFSTPDGVVVFPFVSDPTLDVTTAWNAEFRYERQVTAINGVASASVFYQKQHDLVSDVPIPVGALAGFGLGGFLNGGDSSNFGFEAAFSGEYDCFRYNLNYSFIDIDDDFQDGLSELGLPLVLTLPDTVSGEDTNFRTLTPTYEGQIERHRINASVGATWMERFDADVFLQWRSDYTSESQTVTLPRIFDVPSNFKLGFRASARIVDGLVASINANNIIEDNWVESGGLEAQRVVFGELAYRW